MTSLLVGCPISHRSHQPGCICMHGRSRPVDPTCSTPPPPPLSLRSHTADRGDAVLSFSHFLPSERTLPDWADPTASEFDPSWLDHPAASTAVKFSKVARSPRDRTEIEPRSNRDRTEIASHLYRTPQQLFITQSTRPAVRPPRSPRPARLQLTQPSPLPLCIALSMYGRYRSPVPA